MLQDKGLIKIKMIGLGSYGIDKIDYLIKKKIKCIEYIAVGKEDKKLQNSLADIKIILGGEQSFFLEEIENFLKDLDVLFITSEINNNLEEQLLFEICRRAKDMDILVIFLSSINSTLEEYLKVKTLKGCVDAIIISENKFLEGSFGNVNSFFKVTIRGIADLITSSQLIGLDYEDIKETLLNSGIITVGFGEARGKNRVLEATEQALKKLSFERSVNDFGKILLNITASKVIGLEEIFTAVSYIVKKTTKDHSNVLPSIVKLDSLGEKLNITIIAIEK